MRVNAVAPGEIETAMLSPETETLIPRIPLQRLGKPEDVAATIFYLCSPEFGLCHRHGDFRHRRPASALSEDSNKTGIYAEFPPGPDGKPQGMRFLDAQPARVSITGKAVGSPRRRRPLGQQRGQKIRQILAAWRRSLLVGVRILDARLPMSRAIATSFAGLSTGRDELVSILRSKTTLPDPFSRST